MKNDSFEISRYLHLLTWDKESHKYVCPVCEESKLSVNRKTNKYTCFNECTGNQVAFKLRQLNNEFNTKQPDNLVNKDTKNNRTKSFVKYSSSIEVLDFLKLEFQPGRIKYNLRTKEIEIDDRPLQVNTLRPEFGDLFGIDANTELWIDCLMYLSLQYQYDPVRNYLERVYKTVAPIDISDLALNLFGSSENLHQVFLEKWLIGSVARIYEPGCDFQECLILQGKQGCGKSTFFKTMAVDWHNDSMTDKLDRDDLLLLSKSWIIEWAELDKFTAKVYHGKIKNFLSKQDDFYRIPYGRDAERHPRRCVIVGTSNERDILKDPTGNRRFWIIPIPKDWEIPNSDLEALRDAIWATAIHKYLKGEGFKLPRDLWALQAEQNEEFELFSVWDDIIGEYLEQQKHLFVTNKELLMKLEENGIKVQYSKPEEMRIAEICRRLGWESIRSYGENRRVRVWKKLDNL